MEEKKHQFIPNIPTSRPTQVKEPAKKQTERAHRKRAPKKSADPAEAIASGPFALGPAKRSVKSTRSGGTSSSSAVKVKVEKLDSAVSGENKINIVSDTDSYEEESDIDFDTSDPNAPCNICRSDRDDEMQVDSKDELVLFQVPDILNSLISSSSPVLSSETDTVTIKQEDMGHSEGKKGRIGTLFIDENGRMELRIGNWAFDLNRAPDSPSFQKLVIVEGKSATDLGQVSQRVICTPQIEKYQ